MAAIYLLFHKFVYQGWTVYSAGDHFIENEFNVIGVTLTYGVDQKDL